MRLDNFLVKNKYFDSRTKAMQSIKRGEIYLNGKLVTKSALEVNDNVDNNVQIVCETQYVSLGGFKMEKALRDFNFNVNELICADIGCSTGGFTDCLLKNGAKKIYAIDINDNLLHPKLQNDDKVKFILKNARNLSKDDIDDKIDLIVADLSFISVNLVLETISNLLDDNKHLLILIKPQFETGEKKKYKNGIIRDNKLHKKICVNAIEEAKKYSLFIKNFTIAPESKEKNKEFLMLFEKNGIQTFDLENMNI